MTVGELIKNLEEFPKDSKVAFFNDNMYANGSYTFTQIMNFPNEGLVELYSDYKERFDEE